MGFFCAATQLRSSQHRMTTAVALPSTRAPRSTVHRDALVLLCHRNPSRHVTQPPLLTRSRWVACSFRFRRQRSQVRVRRWVVSNGLPSPAQSQYPMRSSTWRRNTGTVPCPSFCRHCLLYFTGSIAFPGCTPRYYFYHTHFPYNLR